MILNDHEIRILCEDQNMISPFVKDLKCEGVISYGLSSYGYDARVSDDFQLYSTSNLNILDPKDMKDVKPIKDSSYIIPPNNFALAHTVEHFKMPRNVIALCVGKSTYARLGLIVNVTPLEPEWAGQVTLELSNTTNVPIRVYPNEGICQFLFFRGYEPEVSYLDRKGKYQNQKGVTLPRIKE